MGGSLVVKGQLIPLVLVGVLYLVQGVIGHVTTSVKDVLRE